ncbi:MAG: peptidoglycan DD-metalloendopeptidase family protein [Thainema sp.]
MKRVFLQEAKVASSHNFEAGLVSARSQKQELSGGNRKARTSAAMLGLALSMGASGVIFHRDSEAIASEPMTAEPAFSANPMPQAVSSTRHIVREGQTLWQIAQEHQVDVSALAAINGLSPDALLPVGTALQVPAKTEAEVAVQVTTSPAKPQQDSVGKAVEKLIPEQTNISSSLNRYEQADESLKVAQDESLVRLRQSSDELSAALAREQTETSVEANLDDSSSKPESLAIDSLDADVIQPEVETSTAVTVAAMPEPGTSADISTDELAANNNLNISNTAEIGSVQAAASDSVATPSTETTATIAEVPVNFRSIQNSADADELPSVLPQIQVDQPLLSISTDASAVVATESVHVATNADTAAESQVQNTAVQPVDQRSYQIQPGDTLNRIARQYGVTREQLISANNISNPNVIWAGATLVIPSNADNSEESSINLKETETPVTVAANRDVVNLLERRSQSDAAIESSTDQSRSLLDSRADSSMSQEIAAIRQQSSESSANSYSSESDRNISPYAARLLEEIREMRSQKAEQAASSVAQEDVQPEDGVQQVAAIAPAQSADALEQEPINPEFERQNQSENRDSEQEAVAEERNNADSQLVAAAPVGSESYAPLAQPVSGQMVSPELPGLPNSEEYLPEAISNGYIWPAQGVLTSGYGWRWGRMHKGIDVAAPVGTPIYASASGVVERSGWNSGGYGNLVDIRHPDGSMTRYAHNSRLLVSVGQRVRQGEQIAEMGSTGYSTGPHVHFEIHPPNQGATNPMAFLPSR